MIDKPSPINLAAPKIFHPTRLDNIMGRQMSSAIEDNDLRRITLLLDAGFDVNAPEIPPNHATPMMIAIEMDRPEVVALLAQRGAGLLQDAQQRTPLTAAIAFGCVGCVKALLDFGADPDAPGKSGALPIAFAMARSQPTLDGQSMTHMLLQAGASVKKFKTQAKQSAVDYCVAMGYGDSLRIIVEHLQGGNTRFANHQKSLKLACKINKQIQSGDITAGPNRARASVQIEVYLKAIVDVGLAVQAMDTVLGRVNVARAATSAST